MATFGSERQVWQIRRAVYRRAIGFTRFTPRGPLYFTEKDINDFVTRNRIAPAS